MEILILHSIDTYDDCEDQDVIRCVLSFSNSCKRRHIDLSFDTITYFGIEAKDKRFKDDAKKISRLPM